MAELTKRRRYDRMTDTRYKLTGATPTNMRDFVRLHAAEFIQDEPARLEASAHPMGWPVGLAIVDQNLSSVVDRVTCAARVGDPNIADFSLPPVARSAP